MKTETKEELLKQIDELKKKIENYNEPKFEVGKWYKCPYDKFLVCCQNPDAKYNEGYFGYGIGSAGNSWYDSLSKDSSLVPATDKEVEEALIAEAKRRGFKEGCSYINWFGSEGIIKEKCFWYNPKTDTLSQINNSSGINHFIYQKGEWAEIIKEDKIEIGGYSVEFCGNWTPEKSESYTRIDGNKFTKEFWQAAKVISEHSKAKIMVGCSKQFDVSLETINKIINKWKSQGS